MAKLPSSNGKLGFMNATVEMDKSGRLVVPKKMRDALNVSEGARFEIEEKDEGIFLRPLYPEPKLIRRSGLLVLSGGPPIAYDIRKAIEEDRAARMRHVAGESDKP